VKCVFVTWKHSFHDWFQFMPHWCTLGKKQRPKFI